MVRRGRVIVRNEPHDEALVLCDGWAASYLALPDGRRQILAFLLPGDLLSPVALVRDQPGFSSVALTDIQLSAFSRAEIRTRLDQDARLGSALGECLAERLGEAEKLLATVAQRSAEERVAYLVLQLTGRLRKRNVVRNERYFFPLRQQDMADALGLTAVHISRVVTSFRKRGWMNVQDGMLEVVNREELERLGRTER
jgi:CRP/FNR family transcriptional regulator, anaerobic regulatory protein